jgi:hypothetical protein
MPWRDRFLRLCGPSLFAGITFGDWLALLRENKFAVHPAYWPRAAAVTMASVGNSFHRRREEAAFGRAVDETTVPPPLFVLGMWRSGTTHLHNLLSLDDRFAFPNLYQVTYPHTFLSTEAGLSKTLGFFVPETRPQDNVRLDFGQPSEDEFALAVMTFRSALLAWAFPRNAGRYDRYLTFRGATDAEVAAWRAAFLRFVKKLTYKYDKPLVLKSPPHTARVRLLLDLFPDARFVHVVRDPYRIFPSARHTTETVFRYVNLNKSDLDVTDRVLSQYNEIFDAFFEEKGLIPDGRLHEVRFEDLERDPVGRMRGVYEALDLPDFAHVEPALRRYLGSVSGYRKNDYVDLEPGLKERVAREWRRSFEAFGYPT